MKILFNMGWWLERKMYDIKNRIENENEPPRDQTVYWAWRYIFRTYRHDENYRRYNRTYYNKHGACVSYYKI